MPFLSVAFFAFLIALLFIYYRLPLRWRWTALLVGSLFFYYVSAGVMLLLLLYAAGVAFLFGLWLPAVRHKAPLCALGIALLLLPLLWIKVLPRFAPAAPGVGLAFPLGISFYTLQLIAYIVDVRRADCLPARNPLQFLLFAAFFPQMLQGPIPRYTQLAPQLREGRSFSWKNIVRGAELFLWGCFSSS